MGQPDVMDAFASAAIACDLEKLDLAACQLTPACNPAFARLLSHTRLTHLTISCDDNELIFDRRGALLFAAALRTNTMLTWLSFSASPLWCDTAAGVALLGALTNHPSLGYLKWSGEASVRYGASARAVAGAAFGALIAADSEQLECLDISHMQLGDEGLRFVAAALPFNANLNELSLAYNDVSADFVQNELIPALNLNTGLRFLILGSLGDEDDDIEQPQAFVDAEALVSARQRR